MNCKYCTAEVTQKYCPNCGQAVEIQRINRQYIFNEIQSEFHIDKGILFTIKDLFIRPGNSVREYLNENRTKLVKPFLFIIITSLFYSASNYFFHFEGLHKKSTVKNLETYTEILGWTQSNYGYSNLILGVFMTFWIRVLYKKYNYNFFEIVVLLCFVMGIEMLIYSFLGIITSLLNFKYLSIISNFSLIYFAWAIADFFDRKKPINYIKAILVNYFGIYSFAIVAFIIGLIVDVFLK